MPPPTQPASTTVVATRHPPGRGVHAPSTELTSPHAATAAVDAVLAAHARLPRMGKPPAGQWTPLAGFAVVRMGNDGRDGIDEASSPNNPPTYQATCVALGTGSKCVGASRRSPHGDTVNDGHAEALARRALVRWLVAELGKGKEGEFFERVERPPQTAPFLPVHFVRSPHWALHMVTTATPCGDASIVAGESTTGARALVVESGDDQGAVVVAAAGDDQTGDVSNHNPSTHPPTTHIDVAAQAAGCAAAIGASRRKPGRGPPTLSMSCSDKLARWTVVGVQGALVGRVLAAPLYVDAVTVVVEEGGFQEDGENGAAPSLSKLPTNCSSPPPHAARLAALSRALVDRLGGTTRALPPPFTHTPPVLHVGVVTAETLAAAGVAPGTPSTTPAPTSTAWARVRQASGGNWEPPDVVVGATGRKAGAVKRKAEEAGGSGRAPPPRGLLPAVCKRVAYERWLALVRGLGGEPPAACYGDAKRAAAAYQAASAAVREMLGGWIEKPVDEFWV